MCRLYEFLVDEEIPPNAVRSSLYNEPRGNSSYGETPAISVMSRSL
jgi:hypothetical protein